MFDVIAIGSTPLKFLDQNSEKENRIITLLRVELELCNNSLFKNYLTRLQATLSMKTLSLGLQMQLRSLARSARALHTGVVVCDRKCARAVHTTPTRLEQFGSGAAYKDVTDADVTNRSMTVNLLPLWKGQTKQGVRYGSSILLAKMAEMTKGQLTVNFIPDDTLNTGISGENFLDRMEEVKEQVQVGGDDMIVNLGGDHAIPMMTIPGILEKHPDLRIIWIDAHADINSSETSPSGNYHGMPVYYLTNASGEAPCKISLNNLAYVGVRDTDIGEDALLEQFSVRNFKKQEINDRGISDVVEELISSLNLRNHPVHISFDIDALDPTLAPSTGTKVPQGLSVEDVVTIFKGIRDTGNLVSCDIVEFNPLIGDENDVETTVKSVVPVLKTLL